MGYGGTGNLPVPLGHWPSGTEQRVNRRRRFGLEAAAFIGRAQLGLLLPVTSTMPCPGRSPYS